MKKYILISVFIITSIGNVQKALAQEEGQMMFTSGIDLYRTPISGIFQNITPFNNFQIGVLEGNFFIADKFSLGLGFDLYTPSGLKYLTFSPRFYPVGKLFLRAKAMIPLNRQQFEVPVGLGYDIPLGDTDTWHIELATDYYIIQQTAGLRLGLAAFF